MCFDDDDDDDGDDNDDDDDDDDDDVRPGIACRRFPLKLDFSARLH